MQQSGGTQERGSKWTSGGLWGVGTVRAPESEAESLPSTISPSSSAADPHIPPGELCRKFLAFQKPERKTNQREQKQKTNKKQRNLEKATRPRDCTQPVQFVHLQALKYRRSVRMISLFVHAPSPGFKHPA